MLELQIMTDSGTCFGKCINPYNGCSHGCLYCYGMPTTHKDYPTWRCAQPRNQLIEKLKEDIVILQNANKLNTIQDVFLGSITDAYQPIEGKYKQTQQVITVLEEYELPFTIITKGDLVLRDIDLLKGYKWCRVGTTITSLDETLRKTLEPYTVTYEKRIDILKQLKQAGISTYLSGEPIMPVKECNPTEIVKLLRDYVDLFEFGKYTRHKENDYVPYIYYRDNWTPQVFKDKFTNVLNYCIENNINYCISSHSKTFFKEHKLPFKPYPILKPKIPKLPSSIIQAPIVEAGQTQLTRFFG